MGFFFRSEKPKIMSELEQLRNDDHLTHLVKPLLERYRHDIKVLAKLSRNCAPVEQQETVYQNICSQEKYITKFGHTFVIESQFPFAYCMTNERYKKYLALKSTKRYWKDALAYSS